MKRRNFLSSALFGAAASALPSISQPLLPAAQAATSGGDRLQLGNTNHRLEFDPKTAQLLSLRNVGDSTQEFIESEVPEPMFIIQYVDGTKSFRQIASTEASHTSVSILAGVLTAKFHQLGGLDLNAEVTVRTSNEDPASRWSIEVDNNSGLLITDVQFPFVIVRYHLDGQTGTEALLRPYSVGQLQRAPEPAQMHPDSPVAWQFLPENGDSGHYPGLTFAQFLAYYNDRAGVYMACDDTAGSIKLIKTVHRGKGIRLGVAHVGDWPSHGSRALGYHVVLRTFKGDWYDAAELYRQWSLQQAWARAPLHKRPTVPRWLLDSPPHLVFRIQGEIDAGPAPLNTQFVPYPRIIPLAEKAAKHLNAPVVPIIMAWERPGPWVYPDCFSPAGGDQSLREFTSAARTRDWHVGTYCNGTRWVTAHYWTGYDGRTYFEDHDGNASVCRTVDGRRWAESWDRLWRPSYACCAAAPPTQQIAERFVQHLLDDGLDWIQFLDQNVGCCTFPCFSTAHGHSPAPGRWMTSAMEELLSKLRAAADKTGRQVVLSVENAPNEYFMSRFDICDVRVAPPGYTRYEPDFVPLWNFLYHEFTLIQGSFGYGPDPYYTSTRNAYNFVTGAIPASILTGTGQLLNREGDPWAAWEPPMGNEDDTWEVFRTTTALRCGKAHDFLVYGRMERPANIDGIVTKSWLYKERENRIPAVFHSAWSSPNGRFGIVLANWTSEGQTVHIHDRRLGPRYVKTVSATEMASTTHTAGTAAVEVLLPPLSCVLLEATS